MEQKTPCHRCDSQPAKQVTLATIQETDSKQLSYFIGKYLCGKCQKAIMEDRLLWKNIPLLWWQAKRYQNNKRLFIAACEVDGQEVIRLTTNLPEEPLNQANREIYLKNWSENQGLYKWLLSECLVESTDVFVPTGFTVVPLVRMIDRFMSLLELTDEDLAI